MISGISIINTSVLGNFRRTIEVMAGPAQLEVTLGVGEVGFPEELVETVRADPPSRFALSLRFGIDSRRRALTGSERA